MVMVTRSICLSRIIAKGAETNDQHQGFSHFPGPLLVACRISRDFHAGKPLTARTCDTFAQSALLSPPTIQTRILDHEDSPMF